MVEALIRYFLISYKAIISKLAIILSYIGAKPIPILRKEG